MNVTSPDDSNPGEFNWVFLVIPLPFVAIGVAGNILVCMAVSMEKRLQTDTNYFLLSLAITDLLVCLIVWPFSIIHVSMGYWPLNVILCDIYVTSDVFMCTSSILHLCMISLERYLAIRNPLTSRNRSKKYVRMEIFSVWTLSLAISSPIMILGIVDEKNILNENQCVLSQNDFIIYGSVSAFFIPLGIMGILFVFTSHLLCIQWRICDPKQWKEGELNMRRFKSHQAFSLRNRKWTTTNDRKLKSKARRTKSLPEPRVLKSKASENNGKSSHKSEPHTLSSYSNLSMAGTESDMSINTPPTSPALSQSSSDFKLSFQQFKQQTSPICETDEDGANDRNIMVSMETTFTPLPSSVERISSTYSTEFEQSNSKYDAATNRHSYANDSTPSEENNHEVDLPTTNSAPSRLHELMKRPTSSSSYMRNSSSTLMSKKDSVKQKEVKNTVKTEKRACKTLGILFATFVVCWLPFFVVNIMAVACTECEFNHLMVLSFEWLGYISSTLNPIIYTVRNKTFRTTFKKLLKCDYKTIQKPMRIQAICSGIHSLQTRGTTHIPL